MKEFNYRYGYAFASRAAVAVAAIWCVSFSLFMLSMHYPTLLIFGLIVGIYSLMFLGNGMRVNRMIMPIRWYQCLWVIFVTYMLASFITTAVQGMYFRFIDHGATISLIQEAIHQPEFQELLKQMTPNPKEVMVMYENLDLKTLILAMMHFNIEISVLISLPTLLISLLGSKRGSEE